MSEDSPGDDEHGTGLPPGVRTWGRVYLLVAVMFVVYVLLMVALQRALA